MTPIRVLHMIGCLEVGGSQSMVMNLYRNIDRTKVQFDFIIDKEVESPFINEIKELGGKIFKLPKYNGKNYFDLRNKWNSFFVEHSEYKILHSHVRSYASLYLPIAKKHGLKTIIHSHSTSNGNGISSIIKRILQFPLRWQADYFFACSIESGRWLFGNKVILKKNFKVIPNAIDIEKFKFDKNSRDHICSEFKINGKFLIGHIGRFIETKNHSFILEVFNEINKLIPESVLMLIGDGELKESIQKNAQDMGISNHIIFTGVRNDIPELLSAMDVFLFPSIYEGLPVTIIEAQAASLPCFISDTITQEVNISDLVSVLPLQIGAKSWAKKICSSEIVKHNVNDKLRESGFSIDNTVDSLSDFYFNII